MLWSLLFLLVTSAAPDGGRTLQGGSHSNPPPTIVELDSDARLQTLLVRWRADRVSSARPFRVQVAWGTTSNIVSESNVTASDDGGLWNWTWLSEWPLECADHWVRVGDPPVINWSEWKVKGVQKTEEKSEISMFPIQKVIKEGSTQGFCCIPPRGRNITKMEFSYAHYTALDIGDGVKGIIVHNLSATTETGMQFLCQDSSGTIINHINYVSFPPQKPRNLTCETNDLKTVNCRWDPGRPPNLAIKYKRNYTLLIQNSLKPAIQCCPSSCSFSTIPGWKEYNLTVMVANDLGQESEHYVFSITDMVSPVPLLVSVEPDVHSANVSWTLESDFSGMDIVCQIKSSMNSTQVNYTLQWLADGKHKGRLDGLRSYTEYTILVSCYLAGTTRSSRTWVSSKPFKTKMEAPSVTLDLWRIIEPFGSGRNVTLLWKTNQNDFETNIVIQNYQVVWDEQKNLSISGDENRTTITIGLGKCEISVRAVNEKGFSKPAKIIIPPLELVSGPPMEIKRIKNSTLKGFSLSWVADTNATCGYTVEWYNPRENLEVQWKTLPVDSTSLFLPADTFMFQPGHRYYFRIFGCTCDGHRLLEEQAGYTKEEKPTKRPMIYELSTTALRWNFEEDDPTHPGFITGYLVTVQLGDSPQAGLYNISVEDPGKKMCTIPKHLLKDIKFTITVQAHTVAGLGPRSAPMKNHNYITNSGVPMKILIAFLMALGFGLLICALHKLIKDYILKVFCNPVTLIIPILELDNSLFEVSEKIRAVQPEDCPCCDADILETPEKPVSKGDCSQLLYCPQTPTSSSTPQTSLAFSSITNMMYFLVPNQNSYITVPSGPLMTPEEPWSSSGGYITTADIVSF